MQIPPDDIHRVADGWLSRITSDVKAAFRELQADVDIDKLTGLLESGGDLAPFVARLSMPDFTNRFAEVADTVFELAFDAPRPAAADWAAKHGARLMTNVNRELRETVANTVADGIRAQMEPRRIARLLRDIVPLVERDARRFQRLAADNPDLNLTRQIQRAIRRRAELIARTETMHASNMGQQLIWEQQGLSGQEKVWIATPDSRTCSICAVLDGQIVSVTGTFYSDTQASTFTGTGSDVTVGETRPLKRPVTTVTPPAHPRCRCTMGIV